MINSRQKKKLRNITCFATKIMPQIIPFYFVSQIFVTFILLFSVIYVLSKYILPLNLFSQVIRSYIIKLTNKN